MGFDFGRPGGKAFKVRFKGLAAIVQGLQLVFRRLPAFPPGRGFGLDGGQTLAAFVGGAFKRVVAALAFHLMGPEAGQFGPERSDFRPGTGRIGNFLKRPKGLLVLRDQVFLVVFDGRFLVPQGSQKRNLPGGAVLDLRRPVPGLAIGLVGRRHRFPGGPVGFPGAGFGRLGRRRGVLAGFGFGFGPGQFVPRLVQALALFQPRLGGGCGRG